MRLCEMTATEIAEVLGAATIARLACTKDGKPYVVPVAYAYEEEGGRGALLVHSLEGRKIAMMRDNPTVCVQVDSIEHMASWRSVVAWGRFQELEGEEAQRALDALVLRLLPPGADARRDPFAPPGMEDRVVMFRVELTETSGRAARP